ncbi:MAG: Fur family transcriptional regulator [Candidatus Paceibacterota bacterium]
MKKVKENFKEILHNNNYKATSARLAILEAFSETCNPLTAEEIFKKVKKIGTDLVTVYRTLSAFEESGIVRKVDLRRDAAYFELATDHHHHHIVCTDCGDIEDFENEGIEKAAEKIQSRSKKFKTITNHSLEFFGHCIDCSKK